MALSTRRGVRSQLLASAGAAALASLIATPEAKAAGSLPMPTNVSGWNNVSLSPSPTALGSVETVTVTSNRAFAEWSSFNLSAGNSFNVVNAAAKNANWILVNRVTGGSGPASISGTLNDKNGQLWIIDPDGVMVNPGAVINVGGLLLSSASLTNAKNFLSGDTGFNFTGATGPIVMNGTINAGGGIVALLGQSVTVGGTVGGANTQFLAVAAKDVSLNLDDNGTYFTLDGVRIERGANGGEVNITSVASVTAGRIVVASAGETSAASIVVAGSLTAAQARSDGTDIVLLAADGTGPDATPTAQTILSNGAVPSWSAGPIGSQGTVSLASGGSLSAAGVSIAAGGEITLAGDITATTQASLVSSTGPIDQTAGAGVISTPLLTGSAATSIVMPDANLVGVLSNLTAGGGLSFTNAQALSVSGVNGGTGNVTLTTSAGGLTLSGNVTASAGAVDLVSAGAISQTGGVISAESLTGSSTGPTTLNGANLITALGSFTTYGAGADFSLTNAQALSVTGPVTAGATAAGGTVGTAEGDLTLTTGGLTLNGNLTATAAGGVGGTVDLVSAGAISQTGGVISAAGLTGSSTGATTLNGANLIGSLGSFTTYGAGADFSLTNAQALTVAGPVTAGATAAGGTVGTAEGDLTLTTTTGGLTLSGSLTATAAGGVGGTVDLVSAGAISQTGGVISAAGLTGSSTGSTTLNGANLIGSLWSFTTYSAGADFSLTNAQALAVTGPVTVGATATGGTVGTAEGDLTLTTITGGLTLSGSLTATAAGGVGGTVELVSTPSNSIRIDGDITAGGPITFNDAAQLGADATLTGSTVTFDSTLDGAHALAITGNAAFDGAVGGTAHLRSLSVSGTTALDGVSVWTTGAQIYTGAVTLDADTFLTGKLVKFGSTVDGPSSGGGGNVGSGGTLDAAPALSIAGTAIFKGAVGGSASAPDLSNLSVNGTTVLDGGSVSTTGAQIYTDAVMLGVNTTLTGSTVTFDSTLDGARALAIAGNAEFDGAVGETAHLRSLSVSGTTALDGGSVWTTGTQTYTGAVTLDADTFLTGKLVKFGSTVDGPSSGGGGNVGSGGMLDAAPALSIAGNAIFKGAVGGSAGAPDLSDLSVSGTTALDGGAVSTTGTQTYWGAVTLGEKTALTGSLVTFGSTLDGAHALAITGNAAFDGVVGGTANLRSLSVSGTTAFDGPAAGAAVTTSGTQTYSGAVTLDASTVLTGTLVKFGSTVDGPSSGNIGSGGTVDAAPALSIAGSAIFKGAVGGSASAPDLSDLSVSGTTALDGGAVSTTGTQTYSGAATLGAKTALTGSLVTFDSTLDGDHALAITGNAAFDGLVGGTANLRSLSVSGTTAFDGPAAGAAVTTSGTQTYTGAVTLDASTVLTGTLVKFGSTVDGPSSGNIGSGGTVDAAPALSIAGSAIFKGAVGGSASAPDLSDLSVSGTTALDGGAVSTTGTQTYWGAATLGEKTALTGSLVTLGSTLDGAHALAITGNAAFDGVVGGTANLRSVLVSGTTAFDGPAAGAAVTTSGTQTYSGAVTLDASTVLTGTLVKFGSTVDGPSSGNIGSGGTVDAAPALSIAGTAIFKGAVGGSASAPDLSNLSVNGTTVLDGGSVSTTGAQTYTDAVMLGVNTTLTGSTVTFDSTLDGARALAIAGNAEFDGAVGETAHLRSLSVSGTTALDGGSVWTTGTQTYTGAVTLDADTFLTGTLVKFGSTVDGPSSGNIGSGGTVDAAPALSIAGSAIFKGAVGGSAGAPDLSDLSVSGTTALDGGAVSTTGTQTYWGAATLGEKTALTGSLVTFGSTLDGAHALAITGNAAFDGVVGGTANLRSLSVSGATAFDGPAAGAAVTTSGTQTYSGAVTLDASTILTGTLVKSGSTVDGPSSGNIGSGGTVDAAPALSIAGSAIFKGAVGGSAGAPDLSDLSVSGTTALDGGAVSTTGTQTYWGAVTLGEKTALTGSLVTFDSTLDGAHALAITGNAAFDGVVGGTANLRSLSVSGATAFDSPAAGAAVTTSGTQTYTGAVALDASTILTGTLVKFGSTVDGPSSGNIGSGGTVDAAPALSIAGSAIFKGAVGGSAGAPDLSDLTVSGTTALDGGTVSTTGAQTYTGAVTLGKDATLTSTGGGAIGFGSTLDGAYNLTVDTAGTTTFGGVVGGTTALASLDVKAADGSTVISGGAVTTTDGQTYAGAVTLDADITVLTGTLVKFGSTLDGPSSVGGGNAVYGGTLDAPPALSIAGNAIFKGAVGEATQLASLTVSGTTALDGGSISTAGAQTYTGAVALGKDATLTSTGGGAIAFRSTLDGGFNLTVDTAGATTFGGVVGGTTALASLTTGASGSTTISGGAITTSGGQSFNNAVALGKDATLTSTGGGAITFGSTLDGGFNLTVDTAGATTFGGVVGGTTALASLTTGASGSTVISGGAITTSGGQSFNNAVTLGKDATLASTGGGAITFGSTLDGGFNLTVDTAGMTTFGGTTALASLTVDTAGTTTFGRLVGGTTALASLDVGAANGSTTISGSVTTIGGQSFAGAVTLDKDATLTSTGGGAITFGSTLDGAYNLTVDTAGTTTFGGVVGGTTALASLTTGASGSTTISGGAITTSGGQSFNNAVTLGKDATLASTGGGAIAFGSTVDGGFNLAVATAGTTTFGGVVGGTAALASLTTGASGSTVISGGAITTSGGQSFNNAVTLGKDATLASSGGGAITFGSTLDGGFNLTVDTAGMTTFGGAVGGTTALASLTTGASGSTVISGGAITTSGGQSFNTAVALGKDATLTSTGGGAITFGSTLDGGFNLTVDTAGMTTFGGAVGGKAALASLYVSAGSISLAGPIQTTGDLSLTSQTDLDVNVRLGSSKGDVTLTASGGDLTLGADVDAGAGTLTLSAFGGVVQSGGVVTAGVLTGSAGASAVLDSANAVASLSGFSAKTGFSFINGVGFTAAGVDGGTSTSLTASAGDLTLAGNVSGSATTLTATKGAIIQTGGVVTATTLTGSAGTSVSLGEANAVGTLTGFTAPSGIVFVNGVGFTAAGVDGGTTTSLNASTGDLTLAGNVSGATITLIASTGGISQSSGVITAGTLGGSAETSVLLADANSVGALSGFTAKTGLSFVNSSGFTAEGVDGGTATSLTASTGDLTLAGNISGGTTTLTAGGAITQTGGVVTATTLTGSAGTSASLGDANAVGTLSGFTAPSGIVFVNAMGFTAEGVNGGPSTSLTANTGDLTLAGNITGTTTTLTALTGSITQTGGIVTATTLTGSAGGGAALSQANAVQSLLGFTATSGLTFVDAGGFSAANVNGGASTSLTAATGQLTLAGDIGGTSVVLTASDGPIVQTGGTLTAGVLTGSSVGPTTLKDANLIGRLGAFTTYGSGADFTLVNAQTLTVTGPLTVGATARGGAAGVAEGNLSLTTTAGQLNLDGDLIATANAAGVGGAVTLVSAGGIASGDPPSIQARDIGVSSLSGSVSLGDLSATQDIAVSSATGSLTIDSASAGGNLVLRAPGDITVVGGLSATGAAASSGLAQTLFAADPTTLAGVAFLAGSNVDVKAGGSISVGGATTAATDARFQATGAISLGAVTAGQDVVADGASVVAGALSAANGDVALQATGGVKIASAYAGDAIVISSGGVTSVSGALTAAGAGTGDSRLRAGDALANTVLGLQPGQITGDVVIAASDVQLGPVSAANGDVLMFARSSGGAAGVTYLGGSASSDAQGDFFLDMEEIAGITAHSLNVFAGLTSAAAGDVSIGALNLPQSLPTLRVYTGSASRVDVFGPVTGASGSSLIIGDTQLRSVLNPPPAAVLALSQGWTPNAIRVEGTIGGLGAGQAFNQVSLSARSIYIAPVEPGLDFETAVDTVRPEDLPVYTGAMTYQIAAANLQLSAAGPGVIFERNLARNPSDLEAGVGLSVGKITIATITPTDAPPSQIALFGVLSPNGVALNGLSAALSLTFPSQAGASAPVRFTPGPAIIDLYKFSTCTFGGGACFINVPPYNVPPLPVPSQIGDISDPYAPTDEEPVTSSGGEITWPSVSGGDHHP